MIISTASLKSATICVVTPVGLDDNIYSFTEVRYYLRWFDGGVTRVTLPEVT